MPIFEKVNYQLICFLLSVDKKCIFGQFLPITKHFRFLTQFTVLQIYTVLIKIFKNLVWPNFEVPKSRFWQSSASQNCHSLYSVPNLNSTFKVVKFQSGLISESQNCTNISLTNGGEIINGFYNPRGKNLQTEAEGRGL